MKTVALISALLMTGCAAQPAYQPTTPATYTTPVSRYNDCVDALASVLAYVRTGGPVLKKCFAGDGVQCNAFIIFRASINDRLRTDDALNCIKTGGISPNHPLVEKVADEIPAFTRQLNRFNAMRRI